MRYRQPKDEYKPDGGSMDSIHNVSTALDGDDEYINSLIAQRMVTGNFPHYWSMMAKDKIITEGQLVGIVASQCSKGNGKYLIDMDDGYLIVQDRTLDGRVWLMGRAATMEKAKGYVETFLKGLSDWTGAIVEEGSVRINFWNQTPRGPARRPRKLVMPEWNDIRTNYEHHTASQIDEFMTMKEWDDSRGKLIIWRGEPGLGKTYALRAMCDNWQTWASIHYITDAEAFLGDPDYLYSVMGFDEDDQPGSLASFMMEDDEDGDTPKAQNPITHRLIILEDAGELVGAEARAQTGQALSRLLNAVDGMFGQGTQCVLMITTNEEKGKLHEAVGRHGRCAKDVTFQTFDLMEAADWLEANGADPSKAEAGMSLSDLYAMKHEHINSEATKPKTIGFAGV